MSRVCVRREIPDDSVLLVGTTRHFDYLDSYVIALTLGASVSTDFLATRMFDESPAWVQWLLALRNLLVKPFGLKTEPSPRRSAPDGEAILPGHRVGLFTVSHRLPHEIVMAEQDRHLDFRVSIHQSGSSAHDLVVAVTTAVWFNNAFGRLYFGLIMPFHRVILYLSMRRLYRRLQDEAGNRAAASPSPARHRVST